MKKKICLILGICYAVNFLIPPHVKNVISGETDHDSFGNYAYKDENGISEDWEYGISTQEEPSDKAVDFTG